MPRVHAAIGFAIVAGFGVLWLWALGAWIARRADVHRWFWTLLGILQGVLVLQMVAGLVLLFLGHRREILHYLYGSLFPVVALAGGHIVARDPENGFTPWKVFGFATFIVFGLTLRALMTGFGAA